MSIYDAIVNQLEFVALHGVHNIAYPDETIPKAHQEFPDRAIQSLRLPFLALDYQVGTGKSLTAAIVITRFISKAREMRSIASSTKSIVVPVPYVVGTWATINAIETELLKPMFNLITAEQRSTLERLNPNNDEYWVYRRRLITAINKEVRMMTYQKFFNYFFKGSLTLADKSDEAIVKAIHDGTVYLNSEVISELNDSVLIVDEFQRLYNQLTPNTYGTCIEYVRQSDKISGLTVMALSGTFLNSAISELIYFMNIARAQGTKAYAIDDYIDKINKNNQTVYKLKANKHKEVMKFMEGKIATYIMPKSKEYPEEILEGELISSASDHVKFKWFKLIRCHSSPLQWKEYNKVKDLEISTSAQVDDEETAHEPTTSELFIPPANEWMNLGIREAMPGVIAGEFLEAKNLKTYGAVPYTFVQMVVNVVKSGKREKMTMYHRRIHRIGTKQYVEILRSNGFISPVDKPHANTLCIACGQLFKEHKRTTKHEFIPARYLTLTGNMTQVQRKKVLDTYNSPSNVYGEKAIMMIFSRVAEIGITITDVNHLFFVGSVPNISTFRQIRGRVARFRSHSNSPVDRRWVKSYVFVYSAPTAGPKELTAGEILYSIKEENDLEITQKWHEVRTLSINCALTERVGYDCKYPIVLSKKPKMDMYKVLYAQLEKKTVRASLTHMLTHVSPAWYSSDVVEALQQRKYERYPWSTAFISPLSIADALNDMVKDNQILLFDHRGRPTVNLNPKSIQTNDIIITKNSHKQALAFSPFGIGLVIGQLIHVPLEKSGGEEELTSLYVTLEKTKGFKNSIDIINTMIIFDGFNEIMQSDFKDRGKLFTIFSRLGAITFSGDKTSNITFAKNRVEYRKDSVSHAAIPIGYVVGPNHHFIGANGKWEVEQLPIKEVTPDAEYDYIGIFSVGNDVAPGKWIPRFRLRPRLTKTMDMRAQKSGMGCRSIERKELEKLYKSVTGKAPPAQKDELCGALEQYMIQYQIKYKEKRVIYSLFETPRSL